MSTDDPDARTRTVLLEHALPRGLLPPGITEAEVHDDD
ncbi:hypothetical protein PPSIR1_20559 [Plesiocystis pacifica SIR-1]|uniref:Uncharacterized protein n=1 Tax=Plesiocystis pacifica SIR-1 TaxID=391625 RepID=A6G288_9BACT|nr:hypothetical protein PPSIR1_20559 [Plesiocystis pacifica SIR-1]